MWGLSRDCQQQITGGLVHLEFTSLPTVQRENDERSKKRMRETEGKLNISHACIHVVLILIIIILHNSILSL